MSIDRRLLLLGLAGAGGALVTGCGGGYGAHGPGPTMSGGDRVQPVGRSSFPEIGFADWTENEPEYVLYTGD